MTKIAKMKDMADVRLLIQEEGRTARNLIAFNVPVATNNGDKVRRKPPSIPKISQPTLSKRCAKPATRVRSASTGRDKKSELQARYWAFLFGNLQRAVDGIYQTCEEDESISECKEVILVLENFTRDFHNLIEWFKVKWAYESTQPPLRRAPLAWEVRKTSPGRAWGTSTIPKSISPIQRGSPTGSSCKSPIDQTIIENKVVTNDTPISTTKEIVAAKFLRDSISLDTSSRNDCRNLNDKGKNGDRGSDLVTKEKVTSPKGAPKTIPKRVVSTKPENDAERKLADKTPRTYDKAISYEIRGNRDLELAQKVARSSGTNLREIKTIDSNVTVDDPCLINNKTTSVVQSKNQWNSSSRLANSHSENNAKNIIELENGKENNISERKVSYKRLTKENDVCEVRSSSIGNSLKKINRPDISTTNNTRNLGKVNVLIPEKSKETTDVNLKKNSFANLTDLTDLKTGNKNLTNNTLNKTGIKAKSARPAYSTVSQMKTSTSHPAQNLQETPKIVRSKTTLYVKPGSTTTRPRPGTSVIVRQRLQPTVSDKKEDFVKTNQARDLSGSVEVLTKQTQVKVKVDCDGWQTVRSRYRRGSTHNLNMATRFHQPSTAVSLPALSIESSSEKLKKNCLTPDGNLRSKKRSLGGSSGKNVVHTTDKRIHGDRTGSNTMDGGSADLKNSLCFDSNSTSMIAAIFKTEAELLERRIQQFVEAQAERERVILEEEQKREEADSQRSQQLSDEEASLQRQIQELESSEIDVDTETDETDGETVLEAEGDEVLEPLTDSTEDLSLEDRYENMLEGMSWAERVDTLAQLQALVARHPGRALELHQKLSSPSRKRSLPETLRRYQAKQACAQRKRQILLMEKSQRLRELLNKVQDVKSAKHQLIEDKRIRMEMKLKRAEENRTQHLLEIVRKAHDEDSKLKEIAFINELEAQNKRHDFMALCQEQEERLQGIQEERQRRQEEKAAKEAAAEERRRALEVERQLRIQRMRQARREREERVGKMQLEREKERQELAREKARDREERLSALHAAQLANQEELQKKIAHKQQESARRHGENIEHIRQRAVESSILRCEEVPPTVKPYPAPKQCSLCAATIINEVQLLSHLKSKAHLEAVRKMYDGREPPRDEMQRFNISQIRDVPITTANNNNANDRKQAKEKQKAVKRRCRKMKQRMALHGQEYEDAHKDNESQAAAIESSNKAKFRRNLKELERLCNNHGKTSWPSVAISGLERCIGEITRAFNKSCAVDQDAFRGLNGFTTLTNLLNLGLNSQNMTTCLPQKSIVAICKVYKAALDKHMANIELVLLGNKILVILDLLLQRLEAATSGENHGANTEANNSSGSISVATAAMQILCNVFIETNSEQSPIQNRLQEIIGYLVAGGFVERIAGHSTNLVETDVLQDQDYEASFLLASFHLLARFCCHLKRCGSESSQGPDNSNSEQTSVRNHFLASICGTECAGSIGVLYATLVLPSHNQKSSSPTPTQATLSPAAKNLAVHGLTLLRVFAELDLFRFQTVLGVEYISLQLRLIATHLIGRLSRDLQPDKCDFDNRKIISELFMVLGYYAVNNVDNQMVLQSGGAGPSVLLQLCSLPFPFYGDPKLSSFTLPTLLAAAHGNAEAIAVLSCELSYQLLEEYRSSEEGKRNRLVRLLKDDSVPSNKLE